MTNPLHLPWYCFILYIAVGYILLSIFDKRRIIKSKTLRYFIVTFVYSLIFWVICDLVLEPK